MDSRTKTMLPPSRENVDLRIASSQGAPQPVSTGWAAAAVRHRSGRACRRRSRGVASRRATRPAWPWNVTPSGNSSRAPLPSAPTIQSRGVGHVGARDRSTCVALSTSRMNAIRSPARTVGASVARVSDRAAMRSARATATFGGAGVTTGVGRTNPEPAARAPPTTRTAAAASRVKPRRRASGRRGVGVVAGIGRRLSRRSTGAVSGLADLGVRTRRAGALRALGRSSDCPLVSAASIASCRRFSA